MNHLARSLSKEVVKRPTRVDSVKSFREYYRASTDDEWVAGLETCIRLMFQCIEKSGATVDQVDGLEEEFNEIVRRGNVTFWTDPRVGEPREWGSIERYISYALSNLKRIKQWMISTRSRLDKLLEFGSTKDITDHVLEACSYVVEVLNQLGYSNPVGVMEWDEETRKIVTEADVIVCNVMNDALEQ